MSAITVNHISTAYGKKQVLNDVSFQVKHGEILGIIGENGSGKSTLIKSICNILPHTGGCFIDEEQLEKMSAKKLANYCSYVPQKSGLEIEMPVLDVVLMGFNPQLKLFSNPDKSMIERAEKQLESIGFQDKRDFNFMDLSEGQKQLCILMRALVAESRVLLMDEPENALDIRVRHRMMAMVRQWAEQGDRAVIVALHDISLALNHCDRLLLLKSGEIAGIIDTKRASLNEMEEALTTIYGRVCLRRVEDNIGKQHLVMLKEEV